MSTRLKTILMVAALILMVAASFFLTACAPVTAGEPTQTYPSTVPSSPSAPAEAPSATPAEEPTQKVSQEGPPPVKCGKKDPAEFKETVPDSPIQFCNGITLTVEDVTKLEGVDAKVRVNATFKVTNNGTKKWNDFETWYRATGTRGSIAEEDNEIFGGVTLKPGESEQVMFTWFIEGDELKYLAVEFVPDLSGDMAMISGLFQ